MFSFSFSTSWLIKVTVWNRAKPIALGTLIWNGRCAFAWIFSRTYCHNRAKLSRVTGMFSCARDRIEKHSIPAVLQRIVMESQRGYKEFGELGQFQACRVPGSPLSWTDTFSVQTFSVESWRKYSAFFCLPLELTLLQPALKRLFTGSIKERKPASKWRKSNRTTKEIRTLRLILTSPSVIESETENKWNERKNRKKYSRKIVVMVE